MRDEWGPVDPDEIELIEPDFDAFEGGNGWTRGEPDAADEAPPQRSRRGWLVGGALVAVVGAAVAALLVWAPWRDDGSVAFDSGQGEATLSDRLVIAVAPGEVRYRDNTDNTVFEDRQDPVGYFFGEPGARLPMTRDEAEIGRWIAVFAMVDDGDSDSDASDFDRVVTVQGVSGTVSTEPGPLTIVEFGPLDGLMYSVGAAGFTTDEVLRFAEEVRVEGDVTVVSDRRVVDGLDPIGSFADYRAVVDLLFAVADVPWGPGPTVCYDDGEDDGERWCIASGVASADVLGLVEFTFGISEATTVHGEPALIGTNRTDQFGEDLAVVAWREGGRLVVVAGTGSEESAMALAETVREATDDEWRDVLANELDDGFDGFDG